MEDRLMISFSLKSLEIVNKEGEENLYKREDY